MGARSRFRARGVRGAGRAGAALRLLADECDDVVILETPRSFRAVGEWYDRFDQVTDEQVLAVLRDAS